jgi:hypothetical protein
MPAIKSAWVARSYTEYTNWLRKTWGRATGWERHLPELVLWYSAAGGARRGEAVGDTWVHTVRHAGVNQLPPSARATWTGALPLRDEVCGDSNPVDWFTGGCGRLEDAWHRLDDVPWIGPKIASFILRDLSLLRDYSNGASGRRVVYRRTMNRRWFDRLPESEQALFVPIDRHVHAYARSHRASPICQRYSVADIQWDPEQHRRAGAEIVRWARMWSLDPRDLDIYWYSLGAGNINEDGSRTG